MSKWIEVNVGGMTQCVNLDHVRQVFIPKDEKALLEIVFSDGTEVAGDAPLAHKKLPTLLDFTSLLRV